MVTPAPVGRVENYNPAVHKWHSVADENTGFQSLRYDPVAKKLQVLDQLLLPEETRYVEVNGTEDGYSVIKKMQVRGAPLIATVGTLSLAVELEKSEHESFFDEFERFVLEQCAYLLSSRPTAVNLHNAIEDVKTIVDEHKRSGGDAAGLRKKLQDTVYDWYKNERRENDLLLRNSTICVEANAEDGRKLTVMTICNTGALATSSFGTALGVIRQLHKRGRLEKAICLETRPYNQGSRLTAYELKTGGIPFVLIADSMAASAMRQFRVDAVLVGADQVTANGDTANKIGTYGLAVLSNYHRVPFYMVTPTSSVNVKRQTGAEIVVEERPANELITFNGKLTAPKDCPVWNPAFDVTPAELITAILTEKGNVRPSDLEALITGKLSL
ncbi:Protein C01G10.9 [Aphelenchoides avenae]|nr:Protein C01G10.9 [Aphelenchus avenae]